MWRRRSTLAVFVVLVELTVSGGSQDGIPVALLVNMFIKMLGEVMTLARIAVPCRCARVAGNACRHLRAR
jgi:hypothetical protein